MIFTIFLCTRCRRGLAMVRMASFFFWQQSQEEGRQRCRPSSSGQKISLGILGVVICLTVSLFDKSCNILICPSLKQLMQKSAQICLMPNTCLEANVDLNVHVHVWNAKFGQRRFVLSCKEIIRAQVYRKSSYRKLSTDCGLEAVWSSSRVQPLTLRIAGWVSVPRAQKCCE